jgi:hypothetical protein
VEIDWNLWGMLPHSLPQQVGTASINSLIEMAKDPWKDPHPQPGDFDAELDHTHIEAHEGNPDAKLSILSRRASRATEMRALLRHARPHGSNAAEQVKRTRPRSTRD